MNLAKSQQPPAQGWQLLQIVDELGTAYFPNANPQVIFADLFNRHQEESILFSAGIVAENGEVKQHFCPH